MDWINPQIAIGNIEDAMRRVDLEKAGVTAVLSLNGFPTLSASNAFSWCCVPLIDGPGNQPSSLRTAVEALHSLIEDGHKVLVHCAEGASRSPFVVACYLATYEKVTFDEALELVADKRPRVAITPALLLLTDSLRMLPPLAQ